MVLKDEFCCFEMEYVVYFPQILFMKGAFLPPSPLNLRRWKWYRFKHTIFYSSFFNVIYLDQIATYSYLIQLLIGSFWIT